MPNEVRLRLSNALPHHYRTLAHPLPPSQAATREPRRGRVSLASKTLAISYTVGGEGGIRTHGTLAGTPHFECGAFDHSATSPRRAARPQPRCARARKLAAPPSRRKGFGRGLCLAGVEAAQSLRRDAARVPHSCLSVAVSHIGEARGPAMETASGAVGGLGLAAGPSFKTRKGTGARGA